MNVSPRLGTGHGPNGGDHLRRVTALGCVGEVRNGVLVIKNEEGKS